MKPMKHVGFLSGAVALTLTGGAFGDSQSNDDLLQRLNAAEARIAELEAKNNNGWISEQRAEEMRNLVYDVLADADTRASLLQSGISAGYDNGAVLGSTDGNWLLRTNLLLQERFIYNNAEAAGSDDDDRYGFENTRTKFIMTGHVVSPEWFYQVDINIGSNGSGRTGTGNAFIGYDFGNGWSATFGSQKAPLMREELVDAQYQLAVERSNINYAFSTGYVDGVAVHYQGENFGFHAMFSDGANTGQTIWPAIDTDYAVTARGEWLAMGNWDQFKDFTSMRGSESGLLVGGALHWQEGESDTFAEDIEVLLLTADVSFEADGWNVYGAFVWSDVDFGVAGLDAVNGWGLVVQGGVYVTEQAEIFARYEWGDPDVDGVEDLSIITAGLNYYFSGHNAKWTTDVGFAIDEVQSIGPFGSPSNITGYRFDAPDDDGQFVIRTQLQILF